MFKNKRALHRKISSKSIYLLSFVVAVVFILTSFAIIHVNLGKPGYAATGSLESSFTSVIGDKTGTASGWNAPSCTLNSIKTDITQVSISGLRYYTAGLDFNRSFKIDSKVTLSYTGDGSGNSSVAAGFCNLDKVSDIKQYDRDTNAGLGTDTDYVNSWSSWKYTVHAFFHTYPTANSVSGGKSGSAYQFKPTFVNSTTQIVDSRSAKDKSTIKNIPFILEYTPNKPDTSKGTLKITFGDQVYTETNFNPATTFGVSDISHITYFVMIHDNNDKAGWQFDFSYIDFTDYAFRASTDGGTNWKYFCYLQDAVDYLSSTGTTSTNLVEALFDGAIYDRNTVTTNKKFTLKSMTGTYGEFVPGTKTIKKNAAFNGDVIKLNSGGEMHITDINFDGTGTTTSNSWRWFNIYGGRCKIDKSKMTNCKSATNGVGFLVDNSGYLEMKEDTLLSNIAGNQYGGAIRVINSGVFDMNDGRIDNVWVWSGANGGAVCVDYRATFNLKGGLISNCYATNFGGAVSVEGGVSNSYSTFNMTGGKIEGCYVTNSYWGGGAIGVHDNINNICNINGGEICNCHSPNYGGAIDTLGAKINLGGNAKIHDCYSSRGAVYCGSSGSSLTGKISISGSPYIYGNRSGSSTSSSAMDIYLNSNDVITQTSVLGKDAKIGIYHYNRYNQNDQFATSSYSQASLALGLSSYVNNRNAGLLARHYGTIIQWEPDHKFYFRATIAESEPWMFFDGSNSGITSQSCGYAFQDAINYVKDGGGIIEALDDETITYASNMTHGNNFYFNASSYTFRSLTQDVYTFTAGKKTITVDNVVGRGGSVYNGGINIFALSSGTPTTLNLENFVFDGRTIGDRPDGYGFGRFACFNGPNKVLNLTDVEITNVDGFAMSTTSGWGGSIVAVEGTGTGCEINMIDNVEVHDNITTRTIPYATNGNDLINIGANQSLTLSLKNNCSIHNNIISSNGVYYINSTKSFLKVQDEVEIRNNLCADGNPGNVVISNNSYNSQIKQTGILQKSAYVGVKFASDNNKAGNIFAVSDCSPGYYLGLSAFHNDKDDDLWAERTSSSPGKIVWMKEDA